METQYGSLCVTQAENFAVVVAGVLLVGCTAAGAASTTDSGSTGIVPRR